ncbi:MAG: response regulator transcription factor [Clostridiales bacterium]|jgi:DNA-binding response OmpR family regulator|nr:response regulator transcription factor [Clostridiales bacterium]
MSGKTKILIVDDDVHIAELMSLYLNKEGYETREAHAGGKALDEFSRFSPSLVILDLMLPEKDGYEVCREIRRISTVPIIMLTAKGETFDKVLGLELGADDYIVKPFEPKELVARVKAVLRRYDRKEGTARQIVVPNMTINPATYQVIYYGETLELPPKEFELLYFLASNPNIVFTRDQLLDKVWGYYFAGEPRTVDVHVKRVREKMPREDSWGIKTVWGVGYKFDTGER